MILMLQYAGVPTSLVSVCGEEVCGFFLSDKQGIVESILVRTQKYSAIILYFNIQKENHAMFGLFS